MHRLMKKLTVLAMLLGLVAVSFTAMAQDEDGGPDSNEDNERLLRRNWSLFLEYYKTNDFKAAKKSGWAIIGINPARFKTLHPKMINIYDSLATRAAAEGQRTEDGSAPLFADTLLWLVDNAIEAFPDRQDKYNLTKGYQIERHFEDRDADAIAAYEAAIKGDYANADLYYLERLCILYSNDPETKTKAIEVGQAILLVDPNNSIAQQLMKTIVSDPEEYVSILRDSYYADPTNKQKLYELANGFYEMVQNYDSAAVYFEKLTTENPDVKNYWQRYAAALLYTGDYKKAADAYTKVTELEPESKEAWLNLARSVLQGGRFSDARQAAEKALSIDSEWGAPHLVIAQAYEAAVQSCVERTRGGWDKMKVLDKLVYLLAQSEYTRAARDPDVEEQAVQRRKALNTLVPTAEDLFVNKIPRGTPYMINKDCYGWISRSVTP